ncbi:hypothetical protein [Streptacidiphilus carbonis]|jgi:hypothetical protein|uniref:hypothetical protein n=1 Tax=Streptacidiphilus carbonis TaxID=105422 RepID=UPI000694B1F0|nr:hypothetical protein [Streptacidiphilus carbonis]
MSTEFDRDPAVPEQSVQHRAQERLLAAVAADGVTGLARVLIAAGSGDPAAASMPVGALFRALPGVDWLTAHDLLKRARLRDDQCLQDLTAAQRQALAEALSHAPVPRDAVG